MYAYFIITNINYAQLIVLESSIWY